MVIENSVDRAIHIKRRSNADEDLIDGFFKLRRAVKSQTLVHFGKVRPPLGLRSRAMDGWHRVADEVHEYQAGGHSATEVKKENGQPIRIFVETA